MAVCTPPEATNAADATAKKQKKAITLGGSGQEAAKALQLATNEILANDGTFDSKDLARASKQCASCNVCNACNTRNDSRDLARASKQCASCNVGNACNARNDSRDLARASKQYASCNVCNACNACNARNTCNAYSVVGIALARHRHCRRKSNHK
jgi:hypothetical protein